MKVVHREPPDIANATFVVSTRVKIRTGGSDGTCSNFYADAVPVKDGPGSSDGVLLFVPCVTIDSFTKS